jgi:uncharacterized protein YjbI with pentapeptide repeats
MQRLPQLHTISRTLIVSALVIKLGQPMEIARADIYQWKNGPNFPFPIQLSSVLCPDGAGVSALPSADLSNRNLTKAYLVDAHLNSANLSSTILFAADFNRAELANANFASADVREAIFNDVTSRGFTAASSTQLPATKRAT